VCPVFPVAAAAVVPIAKQFRRAEMAVPIRVAQAIEMVALRSVAVDVQTVKRVEQTHGAGHRNIHGLKLLDLPVFQGDP